MTQRRTQRVIAVLVVLLSAGGVWSCGSSEEALKRSAGYYTEGMANLDGDRQKAFVSFQKAIQENPKHRDAHYSIGHIYAEQRKYALAEAEFREAIKIDPNYSEAQNYLGNVLTQQDRWQEAIAAYRQALSNPLYATPDVARVNLGLALVHQGDMQGAAEAFEDALLVRPPNVSTARVHLELGRAYYRLGYDAKARDLLTRVSTLDKDGPYAAEAASLLERLKP
jgi:type IV pilus assembly protein PilF